MSLGSQLLNLNRRASEFRQALFGTDAAGVKVQIDYDRGRFPALEGYYSPIKAKQQTNESSYIDDLDNPVVRIPKSAALAAYPEFIPELNKELKFTESGREILLVIREIQGTHLASAEWVLTCEASN